MITWPRLTLLSFASQKAVWMCTLTNTYQWCRIGQKICQLCYISTHIIEFRSSKTSPPKPATVPYLCSQKCRSLWTLLYDSSMGDNYYIGCVMKWLCKQKCHLHHFLPICFSLRNCSRITYHQALLIFSWQRATCLWYFVEQQKYTLKQLR